MSGPPLAPDDIFAKARELRAAGVPLEEIDRYLSHHVGPSNSSTSSVPTPVAPITPGHSKFTAQQLESRATRQVANAQGDEEVARSEEIANAPPAARALGAVASLARDIPGAEAAQAGLRSLAEHQSYSDALSDIHVAEDAAGPASTLARMVGGGLSAAALPGSAPIQGARFGMLHAMLQADPNADLSTRLYGAITEGGVGAATGALAGIIGGAVRASSTPTQNVLVGLVTPRAAVAASESAVAPTLTREEAGAQLQQLLQKNLDEGMAARDAIPPTNWALMEKMEKALKGPNGKRIIPGIRNTTGDLRHLNSLLP